MEEIVKKLIGINKTISVMESCTGGSISNAITNVEGSSEVFKFGAITYSNEYKIKMGVAKEIIDKYTVYSKEVSIEMGKTISDYTNSSYGIGVTGMFNDEDSIIYVSIYDRDLNNYTNQTITISNNVRSKNKELVVNIIINMLKNIIK